jgi:hypothetical protein
VGGWVGGCVRAHGWRVGASAARATAGWEGARAWACVVVVVCECVTLALQSPPVSARRQRSCRRPLTRGCTVQLCSARALYAEQGRIRSLWARQHTTGKFHHHHTHSTLLPHTPHPTHQRRLVDLHRRLRVVSGRPVVERLEALLLPLVGPKAVLRLSALQGRERGV